MNAAWPDQIKRVRRYYTTIEQWYALAGKDITETSTAWAAANRIVYCPIWVPVDGVRTNGVYVVNGSSVAGLIQAGIYLPDSEGKPGAALKLGFLAFQNTAEAPQLLPFVPDQSVNIVLSRGLYFLAVVLSSTGSTVIAIESTGTNGLGLAAGVFTEDAASTDLPAVATPNAAAVNTPVPLMWV